MRAFLKTWIWRAFIGFAFLFIAICIAYATIDTWPVVALVGVGLGLFGTVAWALHELKYGEIDP